MIDELPTTMASATTKRGESTPRTNGLLPPTWRGDSADLGSFQSSADSFLRALDGQNRRPATLRAYATDLQQFVDWLRATNLVATTPTMVSRADVSEYLSHLSQRGLSGVSRARKLAAIREYFRHLVDSGAIDKSPAAAIATPKQEKNGRVWLRPDEYNALLAQAGGNPRDYALLQVLLQTGVRVSELVALTIDDVDLVGRMVRVVGKGQKVRYVDLERKGVQAIRTWLAARPSSSFDQLFLNQYAEPLSDRMVRKIVTKYRAQAGISKKATPHKLRHTFATEKFSRGANLKQIQEWLGHENLNTTEIYVHLAKADSKKVMEQTSL